MSKKPIKEILVSRSFGETRVAILEDRKLTLIEKESTNNQLHVGNIYSAKITSFEKSLNAYFVDYGGNRPGFLPNKNTVNSPKVGETILVQIERGERDAKGAAVTQDISIASCNLVIMPFNKKAGGISQKLSDESRKKLRTTLDKLHQKNAEIGVIIRTSSVEKSYNELESDFETLTSYWNIIQEEAKNNPAPQLIYKDNDIITRCVKDHIRPDISKIIVDHQATHTLLANQIGLTKAQHLESLHLHTSKVPLFTHYQIENEIESVYSRTVVLKSGASLVIQRTEAMTTIDVNSAKSTKAQDIEETAYKTNLEAAPEIARQIKLRNIGGLIVIDFIDMAKDEHKTEIENCLAKYFSGDKAKIQILKISSFGLLEISRQRLYASIDEAELETCPKCDGSGQVRHIESFANHVLRKIEENSIHQQAPMIQVQLPVAVSTYILNERRMAIIELEEKQSVTIYLIPNPWYEIPQFSLKRLQSDGNAITRSHEVEVDAKSIKADYIPIGTKEKRPLVDSRQLSKPRSTKKPVKTSREPSLLARLWNSVFGSENPKPKKTNNRNSNRRPNRNRNQNRGPRDGVARNSNTTTNNRTRKTQTSRLHGSGQLRTNRRKPTTKTENVVEGSNS